MKDEELFLKLFTEDAAPSDRVRFINENISAGQEPVAEADICYYNMGRIIACYTLARKYGNQEMEERADALLDDKFENVSYEMPFCLDNGLFGLGCGLIYLLRNRMVEGDEDEILSASTIWLFGRYFILQRMKILTGKGGCATSGCA